MNTQLTLRLVLILSLFFFPALSLKAEDIPNSPNAKVPPQAEMGLAKANDAKVNQGVSQIHRMDGEHTPTSTTFLADDAPLTTIKVPYIPKEAAIEKALTDAMEKNKGQNAIMVLTDKVLPKVPDQAKDSIQKAIDMKIERLGMTPTGLATAEITPPDNPGKKKGAEKSKEQNSIMVLRDKVLPKVPDQAKDTIQDVIDKKMDRRGDAGETDGVGATMTATVVMGKPAEIPPSNPTEPAEKVLVGQILPNAPDQAQDAINGAIAKLANDARRGGSEISQTKKKKKS